MDDDVAVVGPTGRRGLTRRAGAALAVSALVAGLIVAVAAPTVPASAGTIGPSSCPLADNPVQCENAQPGSPTTTSPMSIPYNSGGNPAIQGFATSMSVNAGGTVAFKVDAPTVSAWHIDIYRMGWYQGLGSRLWASGILPSVSLPQSQPTCELNPGGGQNTGLVDCGNWAVSASWAVPAYAVSGLYVALLVPDDATPGGPSEVPFVVRSDGTPSDVLFTTADATWEAYNTYNPADPGHATGNSLYQCTTGCPPGSPGGYATTPATAVSYNRPLVDGISDNGRDGPFYAEIPLIQFLEENGYDVSYDAEVDLDSHPNFYAGHSVWMSSGHDEYWSANMRTNVTAARDAGVNLAWFSGNEVFWKTDYASSPVDGGTDRTLISYKETHNEPPYGTSANQYDPQDQGGSPIWTGTWRDPNGVASGGGDPENALTGQEFMVNSSGQNDDITVPPQYAGLWLWRNTAVASLSPASSPVVLGANLGPLGGLTTGFGTLGYEWDIDADNGFRPAGEIDLSSTSDPVTSAFVGDYGTSPTTNSTPETHHLSLYRAPSGALVFGAGTVQWAWGLSAANPVQSGQALPGLPATDRNMRQFTVNLLAAMHAQPTTLASGLVTATAPTPASPPVSRITAPASGTAVADGTPETISGTATAAAGRVVAGVEISLDGGSTWHPVTTMSTDAAGVSWTYQWTGAHGAPGASVETRATDDLGDIETSGDAIHLGVTCPCSIFGQTVPRQPDSGLTQPITVGLTFRSDTFGVVTGIRFYKSVANTGAHSGQLWTSSGQLLASLAFTNETASGWQSASFDTPVPIQAGGTYVVSYFAPNGHDAEDDGQLTPDPLPAGVASPADAPPLHAVRSTMSTPDGSDALGDVSATFPTHAPADVRNPGGDNFFVDVSFQPEPSPAAPTNVTATALAGAAALTWTAPVGGGPATSYTVTPYLGATPLAPTTATTTSATVSGLVNGDTYTFTVTATDGAGTGPSSGPSNAVTPEPPPGAPTGVSATAGDAAATVTWTPPSGNPTAFTVRVLSGGNPTGQQVTVPAPATSVTVPYLVNGTSYTFTVAAANSYGTGSPSTASAAVVPVAAGGAPSAPGNVVAVAGVDAVTLTWSAPTSGTPLSYRVLPYTGTTQLGPVTVTGSPPPTTATLTGLNPGTTYSFSVSATTSGGTGPAAPLSLPATPLAGAPVCPCDAFGLSTPATIDALDPSAVNLGTSFSVDRDGYVDGLRFYKSAQNVGTHTGDLWAPDGTLLAQGTFTGETGAGWQTLYLATPVAVHPGNVYEVSYLAPLGHYSYSGGTFGIDTGVDGPPVHALGTDFAGNGLYAYGSSPARPVNSGGGASYGVDVVWTAAPLQVPGAPSAVTASAGDTTATVRWSAPADDGGAAVTSYTVTPYDGSSALAPVVVSGSPAPTTASVGGLSDGVTYTFVVSATNARGAGPGSSPSNAVTPLAPPAPCAGTSGLQPLAAPAGIAASRIGGRCTGYWITNAAGQVRAFGAAAFYGDMSATRLAAPVISITATPDGRGYYLLAADGGVFTFGDAVFSGSTGGWKLNAPVVGMATNPSGPGYWIIARDGGVFTFGVPFYGSTGNLKLVRPVDGISLAPGGTGYRLVASDGGVFDFGSARFYGSEGGVALNAPIIGMTSTSDGAGYSLVGSDGGVFTFGDAPFYGSLGGHPPAGGVVGLGELPDDSGYYLLGADGAVYTFGPGATYLGGAN